MARDQIYTTWDHDRTPGAGWEQVGTWDPDEPEQPAEENDEKEN